MGEQPGAPAEGRLSQAADRLYGLPPRRFVAERDAAAAAARAAGDRAAASAIRKLRRPTVAAWMANLLARERPDLVDGLVALAESLQAAQRRLDGAALRELAEQRRVRVAAAVAEARAVAVAADPAAGPLPLAEVEAVLHAALADPEVAAQLRTGRVVRAAAAPGFGQPPHLHLVTGAEAPPAPETVDTSGPGGAAAPQPPPARERAEAALGRARAEAGEARAELGQAAARRQAAAQELAELESALTDLARRRDAAADRLAAAESAVLTARRTEARARQRVTEAEAALAALPDPG